MKQEHFAFLLNVCEHFADAAEESLFSWHHNIHNIFHNIATFFTTLKHSQHVCNICNIFVAFGNDFCAENHAANILASKSHAKAHSQCSWHCSQCLQHCLQCSQCFSQHLQHCSQRCNIFSQHHNIFHNVKTMLQKRCKKSFLPWCSRCCCASSMMVLAVVAQLGFGQCMMNEPLIFHKNCHNIICLQRSQTFTNSSKEKLSGCIKTNCIKNLGCTTMFWCLEANGAAEISMGWMCDRLKLP